MNLLEVSMASLHRALGIRSLASLLTGIWLTGCTSVSPHSSPAQQARLENAIQRLQTDLAHNLPGVTSEERSRFAHEAVTRSIELARSYRAVRPALLHNAYVNLGWRKRGLCYQWADDLEESLRALNVAGLDLHRCVARGGTYREHNALVVSAHGLSFRDGLVLDAWRHSGKLYWCPVPMDRYPWKPACGHSICLVAQTPQPGPQN